ncbi:MAG: hypothetical protein MUF31_18695 [Akkermansiaceae bacterium]|jgi:hypothetical protein|nr:hypothetical protein [Akkermansiaceae bacterium]
METPESIESKLERMLIPRGFSERGMAECESLIDELAAESGVTGRDLRPWVWAGGLAAAVALAAGLAWQWQPATGLPLTDLAAADTEELSLVSETEGVVSAELAGERLSEADGSLLEPWQIQVVSEERFRDEQTGEEIRVWQPREELVLVPVSSF